MMRWVRKPNAQAFRVVIELLDASEYVVRLKEEHTPESEARIDNLEEFANAIRQFEQERAAMKRPSPLSSRKWRW